MIRAHILTAGGTVLTQIREAIGHAAGAVIETTDDTAPDVILVEVRESALPQLAQWDAPIVAICDEGSAGAALEAGAADCVIAPVRPRELLARIRRAVRSHADARARAHHARGLTDAVVALRREKHALERLACVDPLTGVANRRHALALLVAEWRRSTREHAPLGVVMIDLDCFHGYNEHYGHLGGDACLQRVADAMVRCLRRPTDYLGRYGGEEFIAVLPNTDAVGAKLVAERLRAAVEALAIPHVASACGDVVTITAGFASLDAAAELSADRLIAVADGALLRAKRDGRNRIEGDAPVVRPAPAVTHGWDRFAPVFADPWFADRIPSFLADALARARAIVRALEAADGAIALALAAELEAPARALDLVAIGHGIGELRLAVAAGELPRARVAADELIQYITHVQVIYRRQTAADASQHSPGAC